MSVCLSVCLCACQSVCLSVCQSTKSAVSGLKVLECKNKVRSHVLIFSDSTYDTILYSIIIDKKTFIFIPLTFSHTHIFIFQKKYLEAQGPGTFQNKIGKPATAAVETRSLRNGPVDSVETMCVTNEENL